MTKCYSKLKELREKNNYSYEQMATMLNISKCYYRQLEHKSRRLSYLMAKKMASIFHLKPDDLFYKEIEEDN